MQDNKYIIGYISTKDPKMVEFEVLYAASPYAAAIHYLGLIPKDKKDIKSIINWAKTYDICFNIIEA